VKPRRLLLVLAALLAGVAQVHAAGQSLNWNPNSNSLSNSGNWSGNNPADNDLTFGLSSQFNVSLTSNLSVRSMLFTGDHPAYVFDSNNSSSLTLSSGISLSVNSVQPVTFQSGLTLALGGAQTWDTNVGSLVVNSVVSGAFGITKSGSGTLTLSGANTFSGGVTLNNGTLLLGSSSSGNITSGPLGTGSLTLNNGTKLGVASGTGPITIANYVSLDSTASTNVTVDTANGNLTLSGVVSGNASLTKTAANTLTLSGSNTYTGATVINGGTLSVSSLDHGGSNSGIGASTNAAANLILDGGLLKYTGAATSTNRLFTVGTSGGGVDASGSGDLSFTNSGSIVLSGTNTARTFKLTGTGTGYLKPILGNNGTGKTSLVKDGAGTWILASANTFTGSTTINSGTLLHQTDNALSSLTDVIIASGGTLNLQYSSASIGSLDGSGTVRMENDGNSTLTIGGSNLTTTFGGTIIGTSANKIVKSGTGTLTLSGNNTYARGTEITGGLLVAGHNSALGTGSVTLNGGGLRVASGVTITNTLVFSGTANVLGGGGTIASAVTANGANVLSPGSSIGTLTFSSGLTLASGSAISFELKDANGSPGTGYDLISVTGGVLNLTAATNTITFNLISLNSDGLRGGASNFNPASNYTWTFASSPNADITGFNAGMFNLVLSDFTNATNGGSFSFGINNDNRSLLLKFSPVPEPSTWLMLGTGAGILALRLRRRRS
jgi:fibronectin-binding autotransporter adhesin